MIRKIAGTVCALLIAVSVLCSCGSDADTPPEPTPAPYSYAVKIAYAYKEREANTTRFGEITSYKTYIVYGLIYDNGEIIENRERWSYGWNEIHSMNVSQSEYSYLWVTAQSGAVIDYDFYLTPDMLQNLGGNVNG